MLRWGGGRGRGGCWITARGVEAPCERGEREGEEGGGGREGGERGRRRRRRGGGGGGRRWGGAGGGGGGRGGEEVGRERVDPAEEEGFAVTGAEGGVPVLSARGCLRGARSGLRLVPDSRRARAPGPRCMARVVDLSALPTRRAARFTARLAARDRDVPSRARRGRCACGQDARSHRGAGVVPRAGVLEDALFSSLSERGESMRPATEVEGASRVGRVVHPSA